MTSDDNGPPPRENADGPPAAGGKIDGPPAAGGVRVAESTGSPPDLEALVRELHVPTSQQITDEDSDQQIVEKLRRQGVLIGKGMVTPRVFWPALGVIIAVAVFAVAAPGVTESVFSSVQDWIVTNLGWYYMLVISGFVVVAIAIGASRLGKVKLGREGDEPEFSVVSWFAMLFAAGMGIGLVFYGVGEPLAYATVQSKPGWSGSAAETANLAMAQTFVHWGLHPWAIYGIIGLALAYAIHRRGRPVSIRWALEPLFGDRVKGRVGDVIDVLAIFGTVFGVATSLGLGVQQISSGLASIGIVETADHTLMVILIVVITFLATFSVMSGLGAGIKWLSNINLSLAGLMLISVLMLGPTLFLFQNFIESIGAYLANVLQISFDIGAHHGAEATGWFSDWTIFYWGWWISWSPFVGVFIARISRGRTVRQFIAGVLLVPTLVGFFWFAVLGGTGIFQQRSDPEFLNGLVEDGKLVAERALFDVLGGLPLGTIFSGVAIILVAIFFITSSDSASLVVDMLASGGHPNPPMWSRVLWALLEGALAAALLLAGGLGSLQAAALATALPFSVILVLMCWSNVKALRRDVDLQQQAARHAEIARVTNNISDELASNITTRPELETFVDDRIDYRISRTRGVFGRRDRDDKGGGASPGS